jgi:predicted nucleic acid-binding protein
MILVDTSVWVDHLRTGVPRLTRALQADAVLMHAWVMGELACSNLRDRGRVLELLQGLPAATLATDAEVLLLIEQQQLMGRGIGYVDAHLLAAARLTRCHLWTTGRRLAALAGALGVGAEEEEEAMHPVGPACSPGPP